jgi:hypothetical protein
MNSWHRRACHSRHGTPFVFFVFFAFFVSFVAPVGGPKSSGKSGFWKLPIQSGTPK